MLGASQRYMYDTTVILVHSLKSWMAGYAKPKEIKEELQNSETLTDKCTDVYKKHCKITKSALNKMTMMRHVYRTLTLEARVRLD